MEKMVQCDAPLVRQLTYCSLSPQLYARLPQNVAALTLRIFDCSTASLKTLVPRGEKIPPELLPQLEELVKEGELFCEPSEFRDMRDWFVQEPELLFTMEEIPEAEDVLAASITKHLNATLRHFTRENLAELKRVLAVFNNAVWTEQVPLNELCRGLYKGDVSLAEQSYNSMLYAVVIFTKLFKPHCAREQFDNFVLGMALHDLGMTRMPNLVLDKPGELHKDDWSALQEHPETGGLMLAMIGERAPETLVCADSHHERQDGSGYSKKLMGDKVPALARVAAVADSLASMTVPRHFRQAKTLDKSLHELARDTKRYDRTVSKCLLSFVLTEMD